MYKDKHFQSMDEILERWKGVSQKIHIDGKDIFLKPEYISISYKEIDNFELKIVDGIIANSGNGNKHTDTGFGIRVMIGDKTQGFGRGGSACDDFPRNPELLKKRLDENMDTAFKSALASYLTSIKNKIFRKDDGTLFYRLPNDNVETYIDTKVEDKLIRKENIDLLKRWTHEMSKLEHIVECCCTISTKHTASRFIDTQGRRIFEIFQLGVVCLETEIEHKDNFRIKYVDILPVTRYVNLPVSVLKQKMSEIKKYSYMLKDAKNIDTEEFPVIFSGRTTGTIIHEGIGAHLLSGEYIKEGIATTFKNKVNKKIFPENVTIIDDPTDKKAFGYYMFDDEGIRSQKVVLIENGILRNYLLDRVSAAYFNTLSNGHSRAEWFIKNNEETNKREFNKPEPRVSNLTLQCQNAVPFEKLLEFAKKECIKRNKDSFIYIDSTAGQVLIESSEMRIFPNIAWRIYLNGKKETITNFFIPAKPYEILNQNWIPANIYEVSIGFCGSESGFVPTQERAPIIFVPNIMIHSVEPEKYSDRLLSKL